MNWQPIDTAPKDGSEMLIWCERSVPNIVQGKWEEFQGDGCWAFSEAILNDVVGLIEDASHWMPLPEPPNDKHSS